MESNTFPSGISVKWTSVASGRVWTQFIFLLQYVIQTSQLLTVVLFSKGLLWFQKFMIKNPFISDQTQSNISRTKLLIEFAKVDWS